MLKLRLFAVRSNTKKFINFHTITLVIFRKIWYTKSDKIK